MQPSIVQLSHTVMHTACVGRLAQAGAWQPVSPVSGCCRSTGSTGSACCLPSSCSLLGSTLQQRRGCILHYVQAPIITHYHHQHNPTFIHVVTSFSSSSSSRSSSTGCTSSMHAHRNSTPCCAAWAGYCRRPWLQCLQTYILTLHMVWHIVQLVPMATACSWASSGPIWPGPAQHGPQRGGS